MGARSIHVVKSHDLIGEDFTEESYWEILRRAVDIGYQFLSFSDAPNGKYCALWRHDIDFSVHRARAIARIESEAGVNSTWFVNPRSDFYNIFEPEITKLLAEIQEMGHWLGLHFDGQAASVNPEQREDLRNYINSEKRILETVVQTPIEAVSWHNPDVSGMLDVGEKIVCGMVNCYGTSIRESFEYVSDSNGYWRFKSIPEVLEEQHLRLHVLTHPGWWTPEPMSPRERIERCIIGRARQVGTRYDMFLAANGRENIGSKK